MYAVAATTTIRPATSSNIRSRSCDRAITAAMRLISERRLTSAGSSAEVLPLGAGLASVSVVICIPALRCLDAGERVAGSRGSAELDRQLFECVLTASFASRKSAAAEYTRSQDA